MTKLTKARMRYVRLGIFEEDLLAAIVAYERMNASAALRLCLREAAKRRGLWPVDHDCQAGDSAALDHEALAEREEGEAA